MGSVEGAGLSWVITQQDDVAVLSPVGELDLGTAGEFRQGLVKAMSSQRPPLIVVDLQGVGFCDSSGLNALIWTANTVEAAGGRIVLCRVQPRVLRPIRMTGLDKRFHICEEVGEATALLSRRGDAG